MARSERPSEVNLLINNYQTQENTSAGWWDERCRAHKSGANSVEEKEKKTCGLLISVKSCDKNTPTSMVFPENGWERESINSAWKNNFALAVQTCQFYPHIWSDLYSIYSPYLPYLFIYLSLLLTLSIFYHSNTLLSGRQRSSFSFHLNKYIRRHIRTKQTTISASMCALCCRGLDHRLVH